jgi:hypothetical protein
MQNNLKFILMFNLNQYNVVCLHIDFKNKYTWLLVQNKFKSMFTKHIMKHLLVGIQGKYKEHQKMQINLNTCFNQCPISLW